MATSSGAEMPNATVLRPGSRLALRIYLVGLVQFVAVASGIVEMSRSPQRPLGIVAPVAPIPPTAPSAAPPQGDAYGRFVVEGLARVAGDPAALSRELERMRDTLGWSVVVRDADGNVVARVTREPAAAQVPRGTLPITLADGRVGRFEYASMRRPPSPPSPPPGLAVPVGLALLVVGIGSWLSARLARLALAEREVVAHVPPERTREAPAPRAEAAFLVRHERLDLRALLEAAIAKFRAAHPDRALRVTLDDDVPPIDGDAALLHKVVDDLLASARDAAAPIALAASRDGEAAAIAVEARGTTLDGLTPARRMVEAHGGTLEVGDDAVARVRLPAASRRFV